MNVFKRPLTAQEIKDKGARAGRRPGRHRRRQERRHQTHHRPRRRPRDRAGDARAGGQLAHPQWNDRNKYYNDELSLTFLEEVSLELVYWLEDAGYPAIIVPPTHVDPWRYDGDPKKHQSTLISLPHAAVEAGLGTLGLNLQLLTPAVRTHASC